MIRETNPSQCLDSICPHRTEGKTVIFILNLPHSCASQEIKHTNPVLCL